MRVIHVIAEMDPGGAERIVVDLAADAVGMGDRVDVASAGGAWVARLEEVGAAHHQIPRTYRSRTGVLRVAGRLARLIHRVRPDVVHTHNVGVTVAARLALRAVRPRPAILTTVHGLAERDYASAARLLRGAPGPIIACAPAVGRSLVAAGLPERDLEVISNGASLEPAGSERQDQIRIRYGLGSAPLVVGLGRLVPQKSWSTLVEAAGAVELGQFVVAGQGPLREELEDSARSSGGRVRFLGAVDDVAALLGAASCLVSTSEWEGLPLSLLEALSLGVPAVVTAVDGVEDVVPEEAALRVRPGDAAGLARALREVLSQPALARGLSEAALRAAPGWAPQTMLGAYRRVYRTLASEAAA